MSQPLNHSIKLIKEHNRRNRISDFSAGKWLANGKHYENNAVALNLEDHKRIDPRCWKGGFESQIKSNQIKSNQVKTRTRAKHHTWCWMNTRPISEVYSGLQPSTTAPVWSVRFFNRLQGTKNNPQIPIIANEALTGSVAASERVPRQDCPNL